jgi:hypothetical protein
MVADMVMEKVILVEQVVQVEVERDLQLVQAVLQIKELVEI